MNEITNDTWFDPEVTTFGDRVAGAREQAGMSQSEMAKRLGVKLETLRSWEDDQAEPRANKLSMMAGLLNVSLLWLISGEGEAPRAPDDDSAMTPEIGNMFAEFRSLRAQLLQTTERLGQLEKNMRMALRGDSCE
jgi:transcriptional regulator with XRE-family HTH domain